MQAWVPWLRSQCLRWAGGEGDTGISSAMEHVAHHGLVVGFVVDVACRTTLVGEPDRATRVAGHVGQDACCIKVSIGAAVAGHGLGLVAVRLVVFGFAGRYVHRRCFARCNGNGCVCIRRRLDVDGISLAVVAYL